MMWTRRRTRDNLLMIWMDRINEQNMAQQSAVDWLVNQIENGKIEIVYSNEIHSIKCIPQIVDQAKEMEKQQIEEAFDEGYNDADNWRVLNGKKYYNETFGE